jgi:hypothetical protein
MNPITILMVLWLLGGIAFVCKVVKIIWDRFRK